MAPNPFSTTTASSSHDVLSPARTDSADRSYLDHSHRRWRRAERRTALDCKSGRHHILHLQNIEHKAPRCTRARWGNQRRLHRPGNCLQRPITRPALRSIPNCRRLNRDDQRHPDRDLFVLDDRLTHRSRPHFHRFARRNAVYARQGRNRIRPERY